MHIAKRTSNQLIVQKYPKFCWAVAGSFSVFCLFTLIAPLFEVSAENDLQTVLGAFGIAMIALACAELRTFEFDRDRQHLRIQQCWIWRQRAVDYPLTTLVAVRLSSKAVYAEEYRTIASRIELVYPDNTIKPLTASYSSDATQRKVAIAIAELLNVEAQVPPTVGEALQTAIHWLAEHIFGQSSQR